MEVVQMVFAALWHISRMWVMWCKLPKMQPCTSNTPRITDSEVDLGDVNLI